MSVTLGIDHKLTQLKLRRIREVYGQWVAQAEQQQLGYAEFLDELLSEEVLGRQENQIRRKLQAAGFPFHATLEQFDFTLRPELKRAVMVRFFDSAFIPALSNSSMEARSAAICRTGGLESCHASAPRLGEKSRAISKRRTLSCPHQPSKRGRAASAWRSWTKMPPGPPGPAFRCLYEHQAAKSGPSSWSESSRLPKPCARSSPMAQPFSRAAAMSGLM